MIRIIYFWSLKSINFIAKPKRAIKICAKYPPKECPIMIIF
ncbi:hypothetical protein ABZN45_01575 [Campylobacter sp. MRC_CM3]